MRSEWGVVEWEWEVVEKLGVGVASIGVNWR